MLLGKWKIFTVANAITIIGIFLILLSSIVFMDGRRLSAFFLFILAGLSDYFDGVAARYIEKRAPGKGISPFGEILDPIRDRALLLVLFLFNETLAILVILFEALSFLFAVKARRVKKKHIITSTSKIMTAIQLITVCLLFLFPKEIWLFVFIISGSAIRATSYFRVTRRHDH